MPEIDVYSNSRNTESSNPFNQQVNMRPCVDNSSRVRNAIFVPDVLPSAAAVRHDSSNDNVESCSTNQPVLQFVNNSQRQCGCRSVTAVTSLNSVAAGCASNPLVVLIYS